MRIAAKVRQEKARHPERFCTDNRCLWRTSTRAGTRPCPKHMRDIPPMIQWVRVLEQGGAKLTDAGHAALGRNPAELRQVCAFCGALIRDGVLTPEGHESHGLCVPCAKEWRRDAGLPE